MSAVDFAARGLVRRLDADIGSNEPGKGAALIGKAAGGTVQDQMLENVAALAALTPSAGDTARIIGDGGDWVFSAADLSAKVAVDAARGIFVAPASDTSGMSGAWVRQHGGKLQPEWFGDLDTPATAHQAIQTAIDLTRHALAKVLIPNRTIETKYPIYLVDGVNIEGEGPASEIRNTLTPAEDANNVKRIVMMVGEGHPAYLASNTNAGKTVYVTWHQGGAIAHGVYAMTLSTAAEAGNYSPGDRVYQRSRTYYRGGGNSEIPHYGQSNIVISADAGTGIVTFKYPFLGSAFDSYLCNWTTAQVLGFLGDAGRFVGPVVGARISGVKLTSEEPTGNGIARAMPLDCDIDVEQDAATGIYLNNACFCRVRMKVKVFDRALEMAMNSTGTHYELHATYEKRSGASTQPPIKLGECSNFNTAEIWFEGDLAPGSSVGAVDIQNGDGNVLTVHRMGVPQHNGTLYLFSSTSRTAATDAGETQEPHRNNRIVLEGPTIGGSHNRSIYVNDQAGTISNCGVVGGRIFGTPGTSAISFGTSTAGGTDCYVLGTWFEAGNIGASLSVGAQIDAMGGVALSSNVHQGCRLLRINGVDQHVQGQAVAHTSGNHSLDMSRAKQTIALSGASINFIGPSQSQIGSTCLITLTNNSGGAVTPTFGANYNTNGWTPVPIGAGQSITFVAKRVPAASGTKVMILSPTAPA